MLITLIRNFTIISSVAYSKLTITPMIYWALRWWRPSRTFTLQGCQNLTENPWWTYLNLEIFTGQLWCLNMAQFGWLVAGGGYNHPQYLSKASFSVSSSLSQIWSYWRSFQLFPNNHQLNTIINSIFTWVFQGPKLDLLSMFSLECHRLKLRCGCINPAWNTSG